MCDINTLADEIFEEITAIRRGLHKIPEPAFKEYKTAEFICLTLDRWGISYTKNVAETGIVVLICGGAPGKTVLLRADIDALEIKEETGLDYASVHEGMMHACGHDVHTAVLLGSIYILNVLKDELCGNVKCVFQPAEEDTGGALPMIEEGIMENPPVDGAVALHVTSDIPVGRLSTKYGAIMGSPDEFDLIIRGKSCHGAAPELGADPICAAAECITALQNAVTRTVANHEQAVISVTSIHSGTNYNIIPDTVNIKGTVRTVNPSLRRSLPETLERIVKGICAAHGCGYEFSLRYLFPPVINDGKMVDIFMRAAEKTVGHGKVITERYSSMAGDDFAYFANMVPSVYFRLGIANESIDAVYPIHSSKFKIDENALKIGYKTMVQTALEFLKS